MFDRIIKLVENGYIIDMSVLKDGQFNINITDGKNGCKLVAFVCGEPFASTEKAVASVEEHSRFRDEDRALAAIGVKG